MTLEYYPKGEGPEPQDAAPVFDPTAPYAFTSPAGVIDAVANDLHSVYNTARTLDSWHLLAVGVIGYLILKRR